ncbi:MAG: CHASE2 domain-containing protein [Oleiphilaceae bacterium]|nr:CHASE2 domain-containing protein [Oleiphilaceae bacterium]
MSQGLTDPRPIGQYLLTLMLVCISALLVYTQAAKRLDLLAYDAFINLNAAPIDQQTVIISIDEKSLNGIGQWPWRRIIHAQLVDKLTEYNAALIAFDVLFSERDKTYPEDDEALARAIKQNGNVLLPLHIHPLSYGNALSEILPLPELVNAAKALGHVHVELDEDGLARGLYLNSGVGDDHWPALAMAMAIEINPLTRYMKPTHSAHAAPYVSVNTEYRMIPFAGPGGTYPSYSYLDVMLDRVPGEVFRDKTVLIGATAAGLGDVIPTPVSRLNRPMSGVELHANAFAAIMQNTVIKPVAPVWSYLLTFAFILIPLLVFPRLKPTHVMPSTMILVAVVAGFSYLLLKYDQSWFGPVNSIIGILLAYPLWSWQRMRHLNTFLSQELERLTNEPDLSFRHVAQHSIERIFLSLISLLPVQHYLLIKNNHPLHSFEKEKLDPVTVNEFGEWLHDKSASWIKLRVGEDQYKLGLGWQTDIALRSVREYLDKLDLDKEPHQKPRRFYEQMANRIAQVREAISAMQDMRTFISKGFEEIPGAVVVCDPIGMLVYSNSRANTWLKLPNGSLDRPIHDLFSDQADADKMKQAIQRVLLHGDALDLEIQLGERDILVHLLPFLVDEESDAGLMMTMSDITKIRQQQREKNQLIDFLSHDVRSPLVSQLAMLDGIKQGRISWDSRVLDDLANHAKRSLNLSEQFLQITRAEQSDGADFYEFDLLNALDNSIDSLDQQAQQKDIAINCEVDDCIWLRGNAELVERAITNLLSNAIKYSPSHSSITIASSEVNGYIALHIKDQGAGIAEEELPHIFKRFRRQRRSEVGGEKGAGLGLNFVKVVMEKHQGAVKVASILGQGSTFTLEFPALEESET